MRIKNNISALNAQIALSINESKLAKDLEKLTSGYRINRSGDDAAGLAISEQMRSQIAGMVQAELNARDAIGLVRTGEGAMQEIHAMLTQMNELAVQSANSVYSDDKHRALIQEEADRICQEIDRISSATRFNYINLFQSTDSTTGGFDIDSVSTISTAAAQTKTMSVNLPGASDPADFVDEADLAKARAAVEVKLPGASDPADFADEADQVKAAANVKLPGTSDPADSVSEADLAKAKAAADIKLPGTQDAKSGAPQDTVYTGKSAAPPQTGTIGYGNIKAKVAAPDITAAFRAAGISQTSGNPAASAKAGAQPAKTEATEDLVFQVGPNAGQTLSIPRFFLCREALKLDDFKVDTQANASASLEKVEKMINYVSRIRGAYGALDNALERTISSMNINKENLTAAESRIRDTDMAHYVTEMTKNNIVMQASQAMLAQANTLPEKTLSLLQ